MIQDALAADQSLMEAIDRLKRAGWQDLAEIVKPVRNAAARRVQELESWQ